jgi:hypothetical protein
MGKQVGLVVWSALFLTFAAGKPTVAQDVDLTALIHETQRLPQKPGEVTMAWWIPEEFWSASFRQNKNVTPAQAEEFLKTVRPYTIFAVFNGTVGAFGGITFKSEDQIRASLRLVDAQGTSYPSRTNDELSADIKNMLMMMKPILANMLGPLGQNMHFFVFPGATRAGARIANAKEKGGFKVKLEEWEFAWRLPLDALLPSKVCTGCREQCKSSWNFCPWCGTKLAQK